MCGEYCFGRRLSKIRGIKSNFNRVQDKSVLSSPSLTDGLHINDKYCSDIYIISWQQVLPSVSNCLIDEILDTVQLVQPELCEQTPGDTAKSMPLGV